MENNIKNYLYGVKKSKRFFFKDFNFLELDKISDEVSKRNLYNIIRKLPYELNREEFERKYALA